MDEAMLALQWTNWRKSTTTEENELTRWSLKFQREVRNRLFFAGVTSTASEAVSVGFSYKLRLRLKAINLRGRQRGARD